MPTTQRTPYDADIALERGGPTQNVYVHGMQAGYRQCQADYAPLLLALRVAEQRIVEVSVFNNVPGGQSQTALRTIRAAIAAVEGRNA